MIAEGDPVATRFTARGIHSGPWMSFPANGKIIEHETWWDKTGLIDRVTG